MLQPIDKSPELTALERTVLETALARDDDGFAALRAQAAAARAASRTPSGVGFMTKLDVPAGAEPADAIGASPVVYGRHPRLPGGAEFVVEVRDGRLSCIEAFSYEGMWPPDEGLFEIDADRITIDS